MQSLGDPFLPAASHGVGTRSPASAKCVRRQKHGSHQKEDALSLSLVVIRCRAEDDVEAVWGLVEVFMTLQETHWTAVIVGR